MPNGRGDAKGIRGVRAWWAATYCCSHLVDDMGHITGAYVYGHVTRLSRVFVLPGCAGLTGHVMNGSLEGDTWDVGWWVGRAVWVVRRPVCVRTWRTYVEQSHIIQKHLRCVCHLGWVSGGIGTGRPCGGCKQAKQLRLAMYDDVCKSWAALCLSGMRLCNCRYSVRLTITAGALHCLIGVPKIDKASSGL